MELEQKWNVNPRGLGAWRVAGVRMRGPKAGPSLSPPPPPATHPPTHTRTRVEIPVARVFGLQAEVTQPRTHPNPETHPVIPSCTSQTPTRPPLLQASKGPTSIPGRKVILSRNEAMYAADTQASHKRLLFLMGCPSLAQWPQGSLAWPASTGT